MKRKIVGLSIVAVLVIAIGTVYVIAQAQAPDQTASGKVVYTCPMHPKVRVAKLGMCPMCGMSLVRMTGQVTTPTPQRGCCPGCMMMGGAGTSSGQQTGAKLPADMMQRSRPFSRMMMSCAAMMRAPFYPDSPAALLGQGDTLGLTDVQKGMLMQIQEDARAKARAVLTGEQREKLGQIPAGPMTMMQMCQQMFKQMGPEMKTMMTGRAGSPMMMCPWMQMMSQYRGTAKAPTPRPSE